MLFSKICRNWQRFVFLAIYSSFFLVIWRFSSISGLMTASIFWMSTVETPLFLASKFNLPFDIFHLSLKFYLEICCISYFLVYPYLFNIMESIGCHLAAVSNLCYFFCTLTSWLNLSFFEIVKWFLYLFLFRILLSFTFKMVEYTNLHNGASILNNSFMLGNLVSFGWCY